MQRYVGCLLCQTGIVGKMLMCIEVGVDVSKSAPSNKITFAYQAPLLPDSVDRCVVIT